MLYYLLYPLSEIYSSLNLFRYITFRTVGAIVTALIIGLACGKPLISWLKIRQKYGQPIREDGPESHQVTKIGTPTMGGCLILLAISISTLLWADLSNPFIGNIIGVTLGFGVLGAVDDFLKLTKRNSKGLSARAKLVLQILLSLISVYYITSFTQGKVAQSITFPFIKDYMLNIGVAYYFWGAFVIVGSSNAVNLTDGLDGLAIVPVMIAAACFGLISYLVGNSTFAHYLQLSYIPCCGELSVFLGSLIGAGLGFLWFNAPPAKIFMGDTGSLAVGAALGAVGVMTKHEIVLSIIGGLFVLEAVSVILQVGYFKITGRRIFLMAPIHHHFEKKGWAESTVVIRFWIIASILALAGLSTLKLR